MALTDKQRAFIEFYVQHWNASKAARDAGYSEKTAGQQGYENLKKPEIAREIEARIAAILPKGEIVQRLAARSRSSLADVIQLHEPLPPPLPAEHGVDDDDDESEEPPPLQRLPRRDTDWTVDLFKAQRNGGIHQIKKIKEGRYGTEVEMFDALPAWELAGKFLKFLQDGSGILKYIDYGKLTQAQLQRLADGDDILAVLLSTSTDPGESGAGAAEARRA